MLSVSPATGPLERSYAKLAKICYKDRNALHSKNVGILYLLAVLQIDNNEFFTKERSLKMKAVEYIFSTMLTILNVTLV